MARLKYGKIKGNFWEQNGRFNVFLETWNPTNYKFPGYGDHGQIFRISQNVDEDNPNVSLAQMLRNLADLVENQWENYE